MAYCTEEQRDCRLRGLLLRYVFYENVILLLDVFPMIIDNKQEKRACKYLKDIKWNKVKEPKDSRLIFSLIRTLTTRTLSSPRHITWLINISLSREGHWVWSFPLIMYLLFLFVEAKSYWSLPIVFTMIYVKNRLTTDKTGPMWEKKKLEYGRWKEAKSEEKETRDSSQMCCIYTLYVFSYRLIFHICNRFS